MTQTVGSRSRLWSGLLLIALGVLFLLDKFDYIRFGDFLETWWPTLLIAWGLWRILVGRGRRWGFPLFLIALGLLFQGERLGWYGWWSFDRLWPVLLILAGLSLLANRLRPRAALDTGGMREESGEIVDAFVVWGGLERAVTSKAFRGGEATALMGGIELDLRRAELASGEQRLNLTAVMGGIEVRVPEHWQVVVEGTPLMGGIEDARKPAAPTPSGANAAAVAPTTAMPSSGGVLRIHGFAFWGGIEVKT